MNFVQSRYRNVINPWQTPKEIRLAEKFLDKMLGDKYWRFFYEGPEVDCADEVLALLRLGVTKDWS